MLDKVGFYDIKYLQNYHIQFSQNVMVAHVCNPIIPEAEEEESWVPGHHVLHSKPVIQHCNHKIIIIILSAEHSDRFFSL